MKEFLQAMISTTYSSQISLDPHLWKYNFCNVLNHHLQLMDLPKIQSSILKLITLFTNIKKCCFKTLKQLLDFIPLNYWCCLTFTTTVAYKV